MGEMCRRYAKDLPGTFDQLFSFDQLAQIARLLEQYIQEKGYDEAKLYTKEELDKLWAREVEKLFQAFGQYLFNQSLLQPFDPGRNTVKDRRPHPGRPAGKCR